MTYLPSLLKKIDKFCQLANDFTNIKKYAASNPWDDPNFGMEGEDAPDREIETSIPYFDDLMLVSNQVDDPGLSFQLQTLAELYKYSLQIGGGYATIAKVINNLKNMYGDGSDSNIENILNGMTGELAKAAGGIKQLTGNDNPSFVQRLAQLKQDIENRNQEERSRAMDTYQEEIGGQGQGATVNESPEDLADAGLTTEDAETINPAALGFDNKEDPKTNKGWHTTGNAKLYKNWKQTYNNEILSYETDLVNETDSSIRNTLDELIKVVRVISEETQSALDLSNALKSDIANPTDKAQAQADLIAKREKLKRDKVTRQRLKNKLRSIQLEKNKQNLDKEVQILSARPASPDLKRRENERRELETKKQELALNQLSIDNVVNKAQKRNLILEMINTTSNGRWPGQDWVDKQQQKIDAVKLITKEDYDRSITEERGKQQGRLETPTYDSYNYKENRITPGGRRVPMKNLPEEQQIDLENLSFATLLHQVGEKIGSGTQMARQAIYEFKVNKTKRVNEEYKSIIDEISKAIREQNRGALSIAKKKLIDTVTGDLNVEKKQVKSYMDAIRLEPHFRKILENIRDIIKNENGKPPKIIPSPKEIKNSKVPRDPNAGHLIADNFTNEDKARLVLVLNEIDRLKKAYEKYATDIQGIKSRRQGKPNSDWWNLKQEVEARFHKVPPLLNKVETYLALNLHIQPPKDNKAYREQNKELFREKSPFTQEIGVKQNKKWKEEWNSKTPEEKLEYEAKLKRTEDKWDLEKQLKNSSIANRLTLLKRAQRIVNDPTNPLSVKDQRRIYDRINTINDADLQGREDYVPTAFTRGGPREKLHHDYESSSFEGLVNKLQTNINTGLGTIKEQLTHPMSNGNPHLKPYVDAVSSAIAKNDNAAKYKAITLLKNEVNNTLVQNKKLTSLIKLARLLPHLRSLKDDLRVLSKKYNNNLDSNAIGYISNIINKSERLQQIFSKYYSLPGEFSFNLGQTQALKVLSQITGRLKETLKDITNEQ